MNTVADSVSESGIVWRGRMTIRARVARQVVAPRREDPKLLLADRYLNASEFDRLLLGPPLIIASIVTPENNTV